MPNILWTGLAMRGNEAAFKASLKNNLQVSGINPKSQDMNETFLTQLAI